MSDDKFEHLVAKKRGVTSKGSSEKDVEVKVEKSEKRGFNLQDSYDLNSQARMVDVPIDSIVESFDYQARLTFRDDLIDNLSKSILDNGLFQNIIVVKIDDDKNLHKVVAGETRLRAARKAKIATVTAMVYPKGTDIDKLIKISVLENQDREAIKPFELYLLFSKLLKEEKVKKYEDILAYFNGAFSLSFIKKIMGFKDVHNDIIKDFHNGTVIDVMIIDEIKRRTKKISANNKHLTKDDIFKKYIYPVYEKIKKEKVSREEGIKLVQSIGESGENRIEKGSVIYKKDSVVISTEKLSDDKKSKLSDFLKELFQEK